MLDLLELHKTFILRHIGAGSIAVDFTAGNGHDSVFLSRAVGDKGHVYAFDIQEDAITATRQRLEESGCVNNYTLINDSHHRLRKYVRTAFDAGMFNLGYLPGGDKSVTTRRETTLAAVAEAIGFGVDRPSACDNPEAGSWNPPVSGECGLLAPGGIITAAVYPGHAEGAEEGRLLGEYFERLDRREFCCTQVRIVNSPDSPYFFAIERKK